MNAFSKSVVALTALLWFGPHVVVSQTPTPPPGRFADLTLEISVPNRSYLPLEPIPITVKISNHTALGILGHGSTDFSSGYLRFDVKNAAGEERVFDRPSLELANNIIQRKIIPSGGHFQKTQILSFSLDRYMMSEGNYKLRAVFSNGNDESIRSTWADIRIMRPSVLELGALEYLKKQTNVSSFLHVIGDDEDADNHNSFIIQFPNTRYSEHALFLLAEHYYYRDDYVRAKQYFSQLNANKDFIFADRVDRYLEKISKK
jgi:hypothetical protein